ncbi:MAG: cell envelope integrity protein CreD [Bacteroidetes bacterium]|nr:cell envelope integrity protein CreD [Bacteroidota bacterium]
MDIPQTTPDQSGFFQRNKYLIKGFMISFLILALLIPTFFISQLIRERQERNEEVKREIASQWSSAQTITGPVLVIPYLQSEKDADNKLITSKRYAYFLPDDLKINGDLVHDFRARSTIFKLIVYTANLNITGSFSPVKLSKLNLASENMLFNEAFISFGITDYTGIQEQMRIQWDDKQYEYSAGANQTTIFNKALFTPMAMIAEDINKSHSFSMKVSLRGSEGIYFVPVGKSTSVGITSKWPNPDFKGKTLPEKNIQANGFTASWKAFDLNREFPQQWKETADVQLSGSEFGVNLLQPLDNYAKTSRTIKYAILVIMLTFVVYFFIEVLQKKSVHAVQYVLIGFALCIFYTLLLSLSEYTSYAVAYVSAALATILLITLYTKSIFNSFKTAGIFGSFLSLLYVFIFILIQLQDGALLAGSVGLFIILAAIMYFSRKIEWYTK